MKIYLMRHGIARELDNADSAIDSQRPLTANGRNNIGSIARALKKMDVKPNLILSSPYVRAQQTAAILAKEFGLQQHLILSDLLVPDGNAEAILRAIVENYIVDELLIVSHLPCLGSLASYLASGDLDLAINLRKGGVCCLLAGDLRIEPFAAIEWLLTPKILLKV